MCTCTGLFRTGVSGPGETFIIVSVIMIVIPRASDSSPQPQHYHKAKYLSSDSLVQCYSDLDLGPEYRYQHQFLVATHSITSLQTDVQRQQVQKCLLLQPEQEVCQEQSQHPSLILRWL